MNTNLCDRNLCTWRMVDPPRTIDPEIRLALMDAQTWLRSLQVHVDNENHLNVSVNRESLNNTINQIAELLK